jgi:hypothetical protein
MISERVLRAHAPRGFKVDKHARTSFVHTSRQAREGMHFERCAHDDEQVGRSEHGDRCRKLVWKLQSDLRKSADKS